MSVKLGDITTPAIKLGQVVAVPLAFWWMPAVGDQVIVAAPDGDIGQGVVLAAIFAGNAPSSDAGTPMIALDGGAGSMMVDGTLVVSGDVIAGGISLTGHVHGGVAPGSSETDEPS